MDRRSRDDAGTWTLIGVAIGLALLVGWASAPEGRRVIEHIQEAAKRANEACSHANTMTEGCDVTGGNVLQAY